MIDIEQQLKKDLSKLSGLCCWNLKNAHGSWISLNFGEPHLVIEEPKPNSPSQRRRELRNAILRGDFWLWVVLSMLANMTNKIMTAFGIITVMMGMCIAS